MMDSDLIGQFVAEFSRLEESLRPGGAEQRCENCRYWEIDFIYACHHDDPDGPGACHRHAPSPLMGALVEIGNTLGAIAWATEETAGIQHYDEDKSKKSRQPIDYNFEGRGFARLWGFVSTDANEWCGEFAALAPEQIAARTALVKKWREKEKAEGEP